MCGSVPERLKSGAKVIPFIAERKQLRVGHPFANLSPVQVLQQKVRMNAAIPADREAQLKQKLSYVVGSDFFSAT